jgi:hypothetical protein
MSRHRRLLDATLAAYESMAAGMNVTPAPFAVTSEMIDLVVSAAQGVPHDGIWLRPEDLLEPYGLVYLERPLEVARSRDAPDGQPPLVLALRCFGWAYAPEDGAVGIKAWPEKMGSLPIQPFPPCVIDFRNNQLGVDHSASDTPGLRDATAAVLTFALTLLLTLPQRIAARSALRGPGHGPHSEEYRDRDVPTVQIITLRRPAPPAGSPAGPGHAVAWSHQWIVSGHWRNQKVREGHRLTWIEAYVKGPEGLPLVADRLYRVAQ